MKDMGKNGTCKLCRRKHVELKKSHLLPANIYKKIRHSEGASNSLVEISAESVRFTDKQITSYLLCGDCEQRFGAVENCISRAQLQSDGAFPVRDTLVAQPLLFDRQLRVVSGKAARVNAESYVYFASSILWRAGAHTWVGNSRLILGPYEEQLRVYLLGQAPFPTDVAVIMCVACEASVKDQFAFLPVRLDVSGYRYEIIIPGIQFNIVIGQRMPESDRKCCLLRSPENLVFLSDHVNPRLAKHALKTARLTERVQKGAESYKRSEP